MLINTDLITEQKRELEIARKQASEYAMIFDLLAQIAHADNESKTIESILNVFQNLFSPRKLFYISLQNNQSEKLYSLPVLNEEEITIKERLSSFDKEYEWTESLKGFRVKIHFKGQKLGVLEIDEIALPEYKEHYLNLTMSLIEVCGLAIENARKHQRLKDAGNQLKKEKDALEKALSEIKQLSGLLPICMHCKSIRDDHGYWKQLEEYIQERSGAQFSHSICRNCAKKHYPDYDLYDDDIK
ncbi:hypothetical protein [Desulfamplus magnetovallimortis]|uniref:hypothetical protein n=1 Tax=Desulfamplus magnetovallimortis TaxID=1246637 RepID=UPI001648220F|nr:hypothetical protein [Desulfamplus magnetovallimortis]